MLVNVLLFSLGIAAIAAPLWAHLRLGRVKKRAVVSTLRLMKATPQTSKSPRRLVDIPLLLLRTLILLLVALGFGRLLIPGMRANDAREYAAIVVDVSGSMQADAGGRKLWDEARSAILADLDKLDGTSRVAVVLSPLGQSQPQWESPAQAATRVKALTPGFGANRLSTSLREATRLLAGMPEDRPKVLHVVSDFQRTALGGLDETVLPAGVGLEVTKVGGTRAQNRGLAVEVVSAGATDLGIYSFNDGTGGTLTLDENGTLRELPVTPGNGGVRLGHSGKKGEWITRRIELKEADAIAADNIAWDVYQAQDSIPVWLWEPATGARHTYEQASYYIDRALQPAADGGQSTSRYRPVGLSEKDLAAAVAEVGSAGAPKLLIVPASKSVPAALIKRIVESGGAVVLFGGPDLDPAVYGQEFAALLPVKIGQAEAFEKVPALGKIDESNGLWGVLDGQSRRQLEKSALKKRHAVELTPGAVALASYADGVPFIAERRIGQGKVEFVNTTADRTWNDWPASGALFVPAIHLLAARSLGDATFGPAHQPVSAGDAVTLKLASGLAGKVLKLGDASYPVEADGTVAKVIFDKPGVVDLSLADGTKAGKVAVNFPSSESVLESDPGPVVRQRLESLRQPGGGSSVRWEGEEQGGLAWRVCLVLAALLLLIEPLVANHRMKTSV